MAPTLTKAKEKLSTPISDDLYSNDYPMTGPPREQKNPSEHEGVGMADLSTENAQTRGIDIIVDFGEDEGAGMQNGGLTGSRSNGG